MAIGNLWSVVKQDNQLNMCFLISTKGKSHQSLRRADIEMICIKECCDSIANIHLSQAVSQGFALWTMTAKLLIGLSCSLQFQTEYCFEDSKLLLQKSSQISLVIERTQNIKRKTQEIITSSKRRRTIIEEIETTNNIGFFANSLLQDEHFEDTISQRDPCQVPIEDITLIERSFNSLHESCKRLDLSYDSDEQLPPAGELFDGTASPLPVRHAATKQPELDYASEILSEDLNQTECSGALSFVTDDVNKSIIESEKHSNQSHHSLNTFLSANEINELDDDGQSILTPDLNRTNDSISISLPPEHLNHENIQKDETLIRERNFEQNNLSKCDHPEVDQIQEPKQCDADKSDALKARKHTKKPFKDVKIVLNDEIMTKRMSNSFIDCRPRRAMILSKHDMLKMQESKTFLTPVFSLNRRIQFLFTRNAITTPKEELNADTWMEADEGMSMRTSKHNFSEDLNNNRSLATEVPHNEELVIEDPVPEQFNDSPKVFVAQSLDDNNNNQFLEISSNSNGFINNVTVGDAENIALEEHNLEVTSAGTTNALSPNEQTVLKHLHRLWKQNIYPIQMHNLLKPSTTRLQAAKTFAAILSLKKKLFVEMESTEDGQIKHLAQGSNQEWEM